MENNLLFKNKVVYLQHNNKQIKSNNSNKSLTTVF